MEDWKIKHSKHNFTVSKTDEQAKHKNWGIVTHQEGKNVVFIKDTFMTKTVRWTYKSIKRACMFMFSEFKSLWRWMEWV